MADKVAHTPASRETGHEHSAQSQANQHDVEPQWIDDEWLSIIPSGPNAIAHVDGSLREQALLNLQQTIGNQAVQRVIDHEQRQA